METAADSTEISQEKSPAGFRRLLNSRKANHSTEYSRNFGSKVEWIENFREEVSESIPRKEILEKAVPFATGSCRKLEPEVLVEWETRLKSSSDLSVNRRQLVLTNF